MPEYLAPGVYIEEIERGPRPIEGVATSIAAFLGEAERGSVHPRLVTSFTEYFRHFGGILDDSRYMPDAISGFFENDGKRAFICRIAGAGATAASQTAAGLKVEAIGPGAWGNRIFVQATRSPSADGAGSSNHFRLQVAYWSTPTPDGLYPNPFDAAPEATTESRPITEEFDRLVWDDPDSPDFYLRRLDGRSALVTVSGEQGGALDGPPEWSFAPLAGGGDSGAPTADDYRGEHVDPFLRTGLAALEMDPCRDVGIVVAPGASLDAARAVIDHCERSRFRFAIIDASKGQSSAASLDPRSDRETSHAAFYYPWIAVPDPRSGQTRLVPPSGHVAGVYARTDTARGVWKAPANEVVRGAVGLEYDVDTHTQEMLNPRGINTIRRFPARGIRVWGARTLSTNALWKYVSVRRLFIFLERSIYEGTQWVVFEANDERLWDQVKDTIRLFLRTQWRSGALFGRTEEEAFFITCDRSTMSQDDLQNGRLICEIGVAPVRPAEYVIFRIYQNTAEASR